MTSFSVISEDLSKKYSGKTIFAGLNFKLNKGESAVITGRNGSGKSTLMKIISGLISPSTGKMKFIKNEVELEKDFIKTNMGFVSPYLNLYDELTALENLRLFSALKSRSGNYDDEKLKSYLQLVGLYDRRNDEIKAYSSGMKQKLKIAFSLLHEPALLMMDEPRSNLDRDGISIIENIAMKQKENGILIIATNDEDDLKLCDLKINIEDHKKVKDFINNVRIVFLKDVRSELRTRYVINSLLMFVLVTISIIRFAIGDEKIEDEILTGLLWISIFFSASGGLARTFVKEEEKETSAALKLSASPTEIFAGKLIFNLVLTFILNFLILILFILITEYNIKNPVLFISVLSLGNVGLVAASTIIAAIISKANSKGTLYPVLSFPVLLPLLLTVINATKLASAGINPGEIMGEIQILVSYTVVVITASVLLFPFVWED